MQWFMTMKVLVLVNPDSHRIRRDRGVLHLIEKKLKELEVDHELEMIKDFSEFSLRAQRAKDLEFSMVAVVGGDGTLRAVAKGLLQSKLPMAVIPVGISNVFARALGLPLEVEDALLNLKAGVKFPVDIGIANGEPFLLMLGAGLDAMAVYETKQWMKDMMGKGAYLIAGVKGYPSFHSRPIRVFLEDTGEKLAGYEVVVSNVPLYGGNFVMCPRARYNDGVLDVCIFRGFGIFNYSRYLWGVLRGRHIGYPDVVMRQAKRIKLIGEGVPCHVDSDPFGKLPVEISVMHSSLEIIVPRKKQM